ncbi:small ubiquitin-related modifier 3 isoform X3 [Physeter macrocephalus]|uniref:Small ubiquitin-related modifier 3 isoform X3 n=1 Tax=Physeter macrocephalus TaxID=9755 RepID=A0A9W2WTH3_PHYMC|nr:small ubiquitin-related modifier 3 isoform X3 [Physeter catodon]
MFLGLLLSQGPSLPAPPGLLLSHHPRAASCLFSGLIFFPCFDGAYLPVSCSERGLSMRQIRFRFDGQPISETDTPAQLEMEDEDTIDVFQQQTGGVRGGQLPLGCSP